MWIFLIILVLIIGLVRMHQASKEAEKFHEQCFWGNSSSSNNNDEKITELQNKINKLERQIIDLKKKTISV